MKKISMAFIGMIALAFILVGCGSGSDDTQTAGDTYNVSVDNAGDGDIVVNTGSGTVIIGANDSCIVVLDKNSTRPCTSSEFNDAYADSAIVN